MEMSRVGLSKRETCTRNQWNDLRMVSNCFVTMHLVLSAGKQCSSLLNFPVAERTPDLVIERFADLNLCSLLRWLCLMQHFLHFMVFHSNTSIGWLVWACFVCISILEWILDPQLLVRNKWSLLDKRLNIFRHYKGSRKYSWFEFRLIVYLFVRLCVCLHFLKTLPDDIMYVKQRKSRHNKQPLTSWEFISNHQIKYFLS